MKTLHILFAAAMLTLFGANAQAAVNILDLQEDQRVTGEVAIKGGRTVPLPSGEWVVAGRKDYPGSKGKFPYTQIIFAQVQGKMITRVIRLSSGEALKKKGYKTYNSCDFKEALHKTTVINDNKGDQNCMIVRPWCTRDRDEKAADFYRQALRDLALKNGYYQPAALIGWQQRLADKKNALIYWVGINTDLLVDPTKTERGMWVWDDWKADAVAKSKPKQIAVEMIKGWSDDWHKTLVSRW